MDIQNIILKEHNSLIKQEKYSNEFIYILFEVKDKRYALLAKNVLEIVKIMEMDFPDKMPSCFLGLIEFNNSPVGVLDLREVYKTERIKYNLNAKIIVYKTSNGMIALLCDKVLDIKKLDQEKISSIPYQNENFYDGLYINGEENIYILNLDNILKYIEENPKIFEFKENPNKFLPENIEEIETLKSRKTSLKKIELSFDKQTPLYDMGVSFTINEIKYYINMANVKEFYKINNSKFINVPNTPDFIIGLINIKGEYITVMDIRKFYNGSKTTLKEKSTLIVLNSEEYKLGILADEICESININYEEIVQNKIQKQDEHSNIEFVKNDEIYQIVDIEQLFSDERLAIC